MHASTRIAECTLPEFMLSSRAGAAAAQDSAPENTNQMGGECPILVCSTLTSPLLTVPRKGSLWMSCATELASLQSHAESDAACGTALHACLHEHDTHESPVSACVYRQRSPSILTPMIH